MGHYTRNVTLHPLPGAAPVTRRCTRSEEVQCPRIRCSTTPNKYLHGYTIASHTVRWAHCHCRQPTQQPASSRHALHPLRGTTPVTSRCTRSEEVQCPRIRCSTTPNKYLHGYTIASHTVRWAHCHCRQPTQQPASYRHALHPLRGTTPVTSHCTRYGALHPIRRGAMPTDRVQRHSGQVPSRPRNPGEPPEALQMPSL